MGRGSDHFHAFANGPTRAMLVVKAQLGHRQLWPGCGNFQSMTFGTN